jgi:hypothetical protein
MPRPAQRILSIEPNRDLTSVNQIAFRSIQAGGCIHLRFFIERKSIVPANVLGSTPGVKISALLIF